MHLSEYFLYFIFRYDNHHGDEHKHVEDEENIVLAKSPDLVDVLGEIDGYLIERLPILG